MEKEKVDKDRELEWKTLQLGLSASKEEGEGDVERTMVQGFKFIPDCDEQKASEWFTWFEKKARTFKRPEDRWVVLVANKLKGKALEVYAKMFVRDMEDYEEFKQTFCGFTNCGPKPIACNLKVGRSELVTSTLTLLIIWSRHLRSGLEASRSSLSRTWRS